MNFNLDLHSLFISYIQFEEKKWMFICIESRNIIEINKSNNSFGGHTVHWIYYSLTECYVVPKNTMVETVEYNMFSHGAYN